MSEAFVVHLPKGRTIAGAIISVALTVWGVYLVAAWHSRVNGIVGLVLLAIFAPCSAVVIRTLALNEPTLTVSDDGIKTPKLGLVHWSEITSLSVDEKRMLLVTRRGSSQTGRHWMDVEPIGLRAAIQEHSGGSWLSGQWRSRDS